MIDAILEEDKQRPRKQRHTAKRIFERLQAEHAYPGGYTIVKDYVRQSRISGQEMFVPLSHAPGEAQADFGEAVVVIAGVEQTAQFMVFDPSFHRKSPRRLWKRGHLRLKTDSAAHRSAR